MVDQLLSKTFFLFEMNREKHPIEHYKGRPVDHACGDGILCSKCRSSHACAQRHGSCHVSGVM